MLSFQQLAEHARDALGVASGQAIAGGYGVADVVNLAGRWLTASHEWAWLDQALATLDFVAGQEYVELPADFRTLEAVTPTGNATGCVYMSTMAAIIQYRQDGLNDSTGRWVALSYRSTEKKNRVPVLEVYPTPSGDTDGGLTLYYSSQWGRIEEGEMAPIPEFMEPLLVQVVREYALGLAEDGALAVPVRMANLRATGFYRDFQRQDGQSQPDVGRLRNTVGTPGGALPYPPTGNYLNPTSGS